MSEPNKNGFLGAEIAPASQLVMRLLPAGKNRMISVLTKVSFEIKRDSFSACEGNCRIK